MSCQYMSTLVSTATLTTGDVVDILISDGVVAEVVDADPVPRSTHGIREVIAADGYLLFPAPVEPHAHLDKAFLSNRVPNPTEDLAGAIAAVRSAYPSMDAADVTRRASHAIGLAVAHGYGAIRTHVDCRAEIGPGNVEVICRLRDQVREVVDIQVVALGGEITAPDGPAHRKSLIAALEAGADLVGGCPWLEPEPERAINDYFTIAGEYGLGIDFHIDETTDSDSRTLRMLAREVIDRAFALPVTASHCVSLGVQSPEEIRETAQLVAEAGITVVALPQTNLYLQGRRAGSAGPRGLTALDSLEAAGVVVAAGGDNWRDPFNPLGRVDPMETASLLVSAGHRKLASALEAVTDRARFVMGLPPIEVAPGFAADLLLIRADSLADAIGGASEERIVLKGGRVVARTRLDRTLAPPLSDGS